MMMFGPLHARLHGPALAYGYARYIQYIFQLDSRGEVGNFDRRANSITFENIHCID